MNVSNISSVKNMAEEAMETIAQTKAEAAKGDQQAMRKLARTQPANQAQQPQSTVDSSRRKMDVKA